MKVDHALANRFAKRLTELGYSQYSFAPLVGRNRSSVSRWTRGIVPIPASVRPIASIVLGWTADDWNTDTTTQ